MTIGESFPVVEFPLTREIFDRLPRHAGYRYDFRDGEACLTPDPRQYHGLLELEARDTAAVVDVQGTRVTLRPMTEPDWPALEPVFGQAFRHATPLGQATLRAADEATRDALSRARTDGSGTIVREACIVASGSLPGQTDDLVGGLLITLLPNGDLECFDDPIWTEQAPPHAIDKRWGRPHLTWVFVHPEIARHGVASAMLDHAVNALSELGYRELASTFLLGNESSTLWHWRNGFRLVPYVRSPRLMEQRYAAENRDERVEFR